MTNKILVGALSCSWWH